MVTITYDHQARRRSYELIAEAFGLEPRAPGNAQGAGGLTNPALASPR